MLKAYENGEDLHRKTAAAITGVPIGRVTKEQRQLVDDDTWARAAALKKERASTLVESTANAAVVGSKTLLTGLATCSLCGSRVTLETAKGGQYTYYNCNNYFRRWKAECPGQRIPAGTLERAVLDHMATKLFTRKRVKSILRGIYTEAKEMDKRNEGQRKSPTRQLDVVKTGLERQYQAIESGMINISFVAEMIKDLKDRRAQLEARQQELKSPTGASHSLFSKRTPSPRSSQLSRSYSWVKGRGR
jgi:Recombinase zinc beta ribbon domain